MKNVTQLRPTRPATPLPVLRSVRLLDQVRERIRYLHYSIRTEDAYVHRIKAFIYFHGRRHPGELGGPEVEAFLIGRPRREARLPVVLSVDEVTRILTLLQGEQRLFGQLLYGTGMRITEGLQLRVKDMDFDQRSIVIRAGKGGKDRSVMMPLTLVASLREQLARARVLWSTDCESGHSGVWMPGALDRKYPCAGALGLVLGLSAGRPFRRSAHGRCAQAPHVRPDLPARLQARGWARRGEQACHPSFAAPFFCNAPAAGGLRHPNGSGTAGSFRREHNHDLHTCAQGRGRRCAQSGGFVASDLLTWNTWNQLKKSFCDCPIQGIKEPLWDSPRFSKTVVFAAEDIATLS